MKMHPSITTNEIIEAVKRYNSGLDNPGFCISCGEGCEGVEPDARKYECEYCGKRSVYGASELLIHTIA